MNTIGAIPAAEEFSVNEIYNVTSHVLHQHTAQNTSLTAYIITVNVAQMLILDEPNCRFTGAPQKMEVCS